MKLYDIIIESVQSLINLGTPKYLAKIIFKHFGKNAYIVTKWITEFYSYNKQDTKNWFDRFAGYYASGKERDIFIYLSLLDAMDKSEAEYIKVAKRLGFDGSGYNDTNHKKLLLNELEEEVLSLSFFNYEIIRDLKSGKTKSLKPFENMNFSEADYSYSEKISYANKKPYKIYDDGFKWVDVGKKSSFIGREMKNCGGVGVMGCDPDRTIFALFDENNKPHVIATYSPNEKMIHGIEGVASSEVKQQYRDYVIDLANNLGVTIQRSPKF